MAQQSEHELWGWQAFFDELSTFLRDSSRQLGNCSEGYVYYVEERLELCVQSVTLLKDHLQTQIPNIPERSREVVHRYLGEMGDSLECLTALQQEWLQYQEVCERASESMAYHVSIERGSLGRGRPRFEISCHQLEYLRSLYSRCTSITSFVLHFMCNVYIHLCCIASFALHFMCNVYIHLCCIASFALHFMCNVYIRLRCIASFVLHFLCMYIFVCVALHHLYCTSCATYLLSVSLKYCLHFTTILHNSSKRQEKLDDCLLAAVA